MSTLLQSIRHARWRRRIALAMAFAVLFAGFAQASHYHRDEGGSHGDVHLQCLLCLHSAGNGAAPTLLPRVLPNTSIVRICALAQASTCPAGIDPLFYEARGPPLV